MKSGMCKTKLNHQEPGVRRILTCILFIGLLIFPGKAIGQTADIMLTSTVRFDASPYLSDWEIQQDMAWVDVAGFTDMPLSVFLQVTMTGERYGEVVRGRSVVFDLPAGEIFQRISSPDMVDWGTVRYAGELRSRTMRTGRIPGDVYEMCVAMMNQANSVELARDCTQFNILIPEPPNIIMPALEESISEPFPLFEWTPVFWLPDRSVEYHIRIVQVMDRQMPQDALRSNIPLLEHQVTGNTQFTYPLDAMSLEPGMTYVWQVQARDAEGAPVGENRGLSDIGVFNYQPLQEIVRETEAVRRVQERSDTHRVVHCVMEQHSFLLPAGLCRLFAGSTWQGNLILPSDQFRDHDPYPFHLSVENLPDRIPDGGKVGFDLKYHFTEPESPVSTTVRAWFLGDSTQTTRFTFDPDAALGEIESLSLDFSGLPRGVYAIGLMAANRENSTADLQLYVSHEFRDENYNTGNPEFDAILEEEMAALVHTSLNDITMSWGSADRIAGRIRAINSRIRDLYDRIREKKDEHFEKKDLAEWLEWQNRIIDRIPRAYEQRIRNLQDSLDTLREQAAVPGEDEINALKEAVDRASQAGDECQDRISDLDNRAAELEKEADELKDKMMELLEEHHQIMLRHGFTGRYGFNDTDQDGGYGRGSGYWYGYTGTSRGGVPRNSPDYHRKNDIQMELRSLRREWRRKKTTIKHIQEELERAREECIRRAEDLKNAEKVLEDAEEAGRNQEATAAMADAVALELENICDEIAAKLKKLADWCRENPDICNFADELNGLLERCPPADGDWSTFLDTLNRLISNKKALEDRLHREADGLLGEIEQLENEVDRAHQDAAELRRQEQEEWRRQQRLREQRERERAEAAASAKERERNNRRIRDLADKARDGSDEALKELAELIGLEALGQLGDAGRNIAAIINGLLAAKELPQCACNIFEAFIKMMAPNNTDADTALYADALINAWRECANLPAIASVMPGSVELARMVVRIPADDRRNMINAMRAALPAHCK